MCKEQFVARFEVVRAEAGEQFVVALLGRVYIPGSADEFLLGDVEIGGAPTKVW